MVALFNPSLQAATQFLMEFNKDRERTKLPYIISLWYPQVNPGKIDYDDIPFKEMILKDGYSQTQKMATGVNREIGRAHV